VSGRDTIVASHAAVSSGARRDSSKDAHHSEDRTVRRRFAHERYRRPSRTTQDLVKDGNDWDRCV
jgi:hypothetical protein